MLINPKNILITQFSDSITKVNFGDNIDFELEYEAVYYVSIDEDIKEKSYVCEYFIKFIKHCISKGYNNIFSVSDKNYKIDVVRKNIDYILKNIDYYLFYETEDYLDIKSLVLTNNSQSNVNYSGDYDAYSDSIVIKKDEDGGLLHCLVKVNSQEEKILFDFLHKNEFTINFK